MDLWGEDKISIHAPVKGATSGAYVDKFHYEVFQSTLP